MLLSLAEEHGVSGASQPGKEKGELLEKGQEKGKEKEQGHGQKHGKDQWHEDGKAYGKEKEQGKGQKKGKEKGHEEWEKDNGMETKIRVILDADLEEFKEYCATNELE